MNSNPQPQPVTIVEAPTHWPDFFAKVIVGVAFTFLSAWLLTMLLPFVFDMTLTYWQCFLLIMTARIVIPRNRRIETLSVAAFKKGL